MNEYGLYGVPAGDPGFKIAVYFADNQATLSAQFRTKLEQFALPRQIQTFRTVDGQLCLTVDCPHLGWYEAGKVGSTFALAAASIGSVHHVEICRSDQWSPEHSSPAEGLLFDTQWATYLFAIEVAPKDISRSPESDEPEGSTENEKLLSRSPDRRTSQISRASNGNMQLTIRLPHTRFGDASGRGAKVAHSVSNRWSISRIQIWRERD